MNTNSEVGHTQGGAGFQSARTGRMPVPPSVAGSPDRSGGMGERQFQMKTPIIAELLSVCLVLVVSACKTPKDQSASSVPAWMYHISEFAFGQGGHGEDCMFLLREMSARGFHFGPSDIMLGEPILNIDSTQFASAKKAAEKIIAEHSLTVALKKSPDAHGTILEEYKDGHKVGELDDGIKSEQ